MLNSLARIASYRLSSTSLQYQFNNTQVGFLKKNPIERSAATAAVATAAAAADDDDVNQ